jgi:hypothetical protein
MSLLGSAVQWFKKFRLASRSATRLSGVAEPTLKTCPVRNVGLASEREPCAFKASNAKLQAVLRHDFFPKGSDVFD